MRRVCILLLVTLFSEAPVSPQSTARPSAPRGWGGIELSQLKWRKTADGTGRERAELFGDGSKEGAAFGWVAKWPPHLTTKAHSHPTMRYAIVLSGEFYQGYGDKFDAGKLERRSLNTYFTEPAGVGHFGATKDEGAIIYFVGIGPDRTDPIEK